MRVFYVYANAIIVGRLDLEMGPQWLRILFLLSLGLLSNFQFPKTS